MKKVVFTVIRIVAFGVVPYVVDVAKKYLQAKSGFGKTAA